MTHEVIAHTPSPVPLVDWTFHHTCNDLAIRVQQAQDLLIDRYTLLGCAGLLRKLLLDGEPLAARVNRDRRLKLDFRAHALGQTVLSGDPSQVDFGVWFQGPSMFPGNSETAVKRMTSVNKWAAHVTGRVGDDDVTVGALIRFASHVEGGVHLGKPSSLVEERLATLISPFLKPDIPVKQILFSPLGTLAFIGYATLLGLRQLRQLVARDWPELGLPVINGALIPVNRSYNYQGG